MEARVLADGLNAASCPLLLFTVCLFVTSTLIRSPVVWELTCLTLRGAPAGASLGLLCDLPRGCGAVTAPGHSDGLSSALQLNVPVCLSLGQVVRNMV